MDGYNNQWSQYGYAQNAPQAFYQDLQLHAAPPPQPQMPPQTPQYAQVYPQFNNTNMQQQVMYAQTPYRHVQQQHYQPPPAEVVRLSGVSQRPQYQQSQPAYHYNEQHVSSMPQQHHIQQNIPQHDGTFSTTNTIPQVQSSQPHLSNGIPRPVEKAVPVLPVNSAQPFEYDLEPIPPPAPPPEQHLAQVLLVLADEYMQASKKVGPNSEEYFKLVSFALGCIESALHNFQLPPLREAQATLVYAQILHEETDNYDSAEKALTKGTDLCERNNYLDLKYAMTLLLARLLFRTKPKAALKALADHIEDMSTLRHLPWLYIFRYELSVLSSEIGDFSSCITQLAKLEEDADRNHDKAVVGAAAVTRALAHLRTVHQDTGVEARAALARFRMLQLDPEIAAMPQLQLMAELVDLCCSVRLAEIEEGNAKRVQLQNKWGEIENHPAWSNEAGTLLVPLQQSTLRDYQIHSGGLLVKENQRVFLPLSWCTRDDAEALCYLLCGISKSTKNSSDGGKAEQFLSHGIKRVDTASGLTVLDRPMLQCRMNIELGFLHCHKGDWTTAKTSMTEAARILRPHKDDFPYFMTVAIQYLNGCIQQGLGNLDRALANWEMAMMSTDEYTRPDPNNPNLQRPVRIVDIDTEVTRNLRLSALINRLYIIQDPTHPKHSQFPDLVSRLTLLSSTSTDQNLLVSAKLADAILVNRGLWATKEKVVANLNIAKKLSNQQLMTLILATMQQFFFLGQTDTHAEKCLGAVANQVHYWRHPLWRHVIEGMQAEFLRFKGLFGEAEKKMVEARKSWEALPDGIKRQVRWEELPNVMRAARQ